MNEVSRSRYKNLRFIQKNWQLSDEDLCIIFRVEHEDLQQWHQVKSISSTSVEGMLLSLMRLYETVSEKMNPAQSVAWLTTPHDALDFVSPIQAIADDPQKISLVISILSPN